MGNIITIASRYSTEPANYYCDGVGDEVEIQAAIDYLNATYDGGELQLSQGTFTIAASINPKANVKMVGSGINATKIDRSGNIHWFVATGTAGSVLSNIEISDLSIIDSVGTFPYQAFDMDYCDDLHLHDIIADDIPGDSLQMAYCDRFLVENFTSLQPQDGFGIANCEGGIIRDCTFDYQSVDVGAVAMNCIYLIATGAPDTIEITGVKIKSLTSSSGIIGINVSAGDHVLIDSCFIHDLTTDGAGNVSGIAINGADQVHVANCHIFDLNVSDGGDARGIIIGTSQADYNKLSANYIEDCDTKGILLDANADYTEVVGNTCKDNGTDSGYDNSNTDNYDDNGANNTARANSWQ